MSKKPKKRARKIALPLDRCGTPIHVGDWIWFEEGDEMVHVTSLTYEGDDRWYAGDEHEECASDNLSGGVVVGPCAGIWKEWTDEY